VPALSGWPGQKGVYARLRRAMPGHDEEGKADALPWHSAKIRLAFAAIPSHLWRRL